MGRADWWLEQGRETVRRLLADATFASRDLPQPQRHLWSKGAARLCDFGGPESYQNAPTESLAHEAMFSAHFSGAHGLVWVRLGTRSRHGLEADLDRFARIALQTISRPFVLVTTDGDISVPSELEPTTVAALLGSPFLRAWLTQNHDGGGAGRIGPMPIGLDLHTPRPFTSPARLVANLDRLARERSPAGDMAPSVFSDIGVNVNSRARRAALNLLHDCPHVDLLRHRVPQIEVWRRYASHPFVLSLPGNGLDCHRTWEALYLGSMVITLSSPLDPLFEGLPVVIVDDCSELLDAGNLSRWQKRLSPLADPERVRRILDPRRCAAQLRTRHLR